MRDYDAEQRPIVDALHSFNSNFKQAIAQVIRFIALLLPWLIIVVPGFISVFWHRGAGGNHWGNWGAG